VISLNAKSEYELYRPIMQPVDMNTVTATSFRADWTDNTPAENVASYSLEVRVKPDVTLLTEADWSDVPTDATNHASDAQNYMPEGWTFTGSHLYLDGGFISANRNCVINPNCDLMGYNVVSIIITAKAYSRGSNTTLDVSTDMGTRTLMLAREVKSYLVVLEVGTHGYVKFTTGYYPEIQSIKIYGGEITDMEPFTLNAPALNDNDYMLIEGITPDKFYTVTGLQPGTPYLYRVMSNYVNGTQSSWSNTKEVLLLDQQIVKGDVDGNGTMTVTDVTLLIDALLNENWSGINLDAADYDGNGLVDIADATQMINFLLEGGQL
jgi:hypothetical protein